MGDVEFPEVGEPDVSFDRSYKLARDNGPNLAVAQATIDQFKLSALKAKRNTLPDAQRQRRARLQLVRRLAPASR